MKKLLQFQKYAIYQKSNGELITQSGEMLYKSPYSRMKSWSTADHTIGYEENSDCGNFMFQRLSFVGEDKKASTFAISMQGNGNIPWRYATAVYEKSNVFPMILRKVRPVYGGFNHNTEDDDMGRAIERREARIYPTKQDRQSRATLVTVVSADKIETVTKISNTETKIDTKWVYNAFDLKITYDGKTIKPKTVRLLPANEEVVEEQTPRAVGCRGREVTPITSELLAKFGIDSEQIIQPKSRTMVKAEISR